MDKFQAEKFSQEMEFMRRVLRLGRIQIGSEKGEASFQMERITGAKIRPPELTLRRPWNSWRSG